MRVQHEQKKKLEFGWDEKSIRRHCFSNLFVLPLFRVIFRKFIYGQNNFIIEVDRKSTQFQSIYIYLDYRES